MKYKMFVKYTEFQLIWSIWKAYGLQQSAHPANDTNL